MTYVILSITLLFVALVSFIPIAFAQFTADTLISHMRETHTILERNVDQVISLVENNHTAEAVNLLEGVEIKVKHMNSMFDDLVWQLSNQGH
ncbi:MAG: hypothetical protein ACE5SW_06740 [Nitrososphaeraceae archaeon]